jgi:arabinogalactan oligomer/maltooligosaccharide transport system permease protein
MNRESSLLERTLVHCALVLAVAFALYPVLWVVATAFSGTLTPEPRALPVPQQPTLEHLDAVVLSQRELPDGSQVWLFGQQLFNFNPHSLLVGTTLVNRGRHCLG